MLLLGTEYYKKYVDERGVTWRECTAQEWDNLTEGSRQIITGPRGTWLAKKV